MVRSNKKPDYTKRVMDKALDQLDAEYLEARKRECEDLHNALCDVLAQKGASPQNTLYVLEILKAEVLQDQLRGIFQPPVTLSDNEPAPMAHEGGEQNAVEKPQSD